MIVAPTWLLMSSPTIGTPASANFCAHAWSEAMNTGRQFTNATPRVERGLRVVLAPPARSRPAGSDTSTSACASRSACATSTGRQLGLGDRLAVVRAEAVERRAPLHGHAGRRDVGELDRVVRLGRRWPRRGRCRPSWRPRRTRRRARRRGRGSRRARRASGPGTRVGRVGVLVVLEALDERRRAVADADDRETDLAHVARSFLRSARPVLRRFEPPVVVSVVRRSAVMRPFEPRDVLLRGSRDRAPSATSCTCRPLVVASEVWIVDQPLLEEGPPAFEQADPRLGRQVLEERQADAEAVVLARGVGPRLLEQLA